MRSRRRTGWLENSGIGNAAAGRAERSEILNGFYLSTQACRHATELCSRFASEIDSHDLAQDAETGLAFPVDQSACGL